MTWLKWEAIAVASLFFIVVAVWFVRVCRYHNKLMRRTRQYEKELQ